MQANILLLISSEWNKHLLHNKPGIWLLSDTSICFDGNFSSELKFCLKNFDMQLRNELELCSFLRQTCQLYLDSFSSRIHLSYLTLTASVKMMKFIIVAM